jgi:3-oxoacyl-[acyl-carrier protein] reductase
MDKGLDPGLRDRVAVVTGANNPYGIGAAVAKALAAAGVRVFLHYFRRSPAVSVDSPTPSEAFYLAQQSKGPEEVIEAIDALGGKSQAWEADLSDPRSIPDLFDEAEKVFGPAEILVNNAAHWEGDTFIPSGGELANKLHETWTERPAEVTPGSIDRLFAVNTRAVALTMSELAKRHIERGADWGRIINVSTEGAHVFPSEISYGASKLALEGYTRSAAVELGRFGITVNTVSLGPIQTGWITPELESELVPKIPLGRIGTPDDVADVVVFLASHQARWVTGQKIHVGSTFAWSDWGQA